MKKACFGTPEGRLMTAEDFIGNVGHDYQVKRIYPYCPACGETVFPFGTSSTNLTPGFRHKKKTDASDPYDDCPLAQRNTALSSLLTLSNDWDFSNKTKIKQAFFEDEMLKKAYAFCKRASEPKKKFPVDNFNTLLVRADRYNIWSYANLKVWLVPFILITLGDFKSYNRQGSEYGFHYIFKRPKQITVLSSPHQCSLMKRFSDGQPMSWPYNERHLSTTLLETIAGDTAWISNGLWAALLKLKQSHQA